MYNKEGIFHVATAPINSKMEFIIAENKGETIQQVYNRLPIKPNILFNGNMYNTNTRVPVQGIKIGEEIICKANYGGHLFIAQNNEYMMEQLPSIDIKCDWAMEMTGFPYPLNTRNISAGFITGNHARMTIGLTNTEIIVAGTTSAIPFSSLTTFYKDKKVKNSGNLDGGGSVGLIVDGKTIINSTRPNMYYVAIYYPKSEKKTLIALDDGHGMETAGKRTPNFPDGTFMHENEFNSIVVKYLKENLLQCEFDVLEVAPTNKDTPLEDRTNLANIMNADFYLSVHANAYGDGKEFNSANGIGTFVHKSYPDTVEKAGIIHKWITKGTKLANRGIQDGSGFWVCKATNMSAVLVELAFMTNLEEAKLLLSDTYRIECANELCQALCEIYNKEYKPIYRIPIPDVISLPQITENVNIKYKNKIIEGYLTTDNRTVVEVRQLAELLGYFVDWDMETRTVIIK